MTMQTIFCVALFASRVLDKKTKYNIYFTSRSRSVIAQKTLAYLTVHTT